MKVQLVLMKKNKQIKEKQTKENKKCVLRRYMVILIKTKINAIV